MHLVRSLTAAAGVAVLVAACGSSNHATPPSGAGPSQGFVITAYRYAACMRSHGVSDFPDPQVTRTSGTSIAIRMTVSRSMVASPQFRTASKACRGLAPGPESATQLAAQQHAHALTLLAFAQCLRRHGVSDFPDPTPQGQLTLEMVRAAGIDLQAPSLLSAAKACVGVTHGAITVPAVEAAIRDASGAQSSGGGQ